MHDSLYYIKKALFFLTAEAPFEKNIQKFLSFLHEDLAYTHTALLLENTLTGNEILAVEKNESRFQILAEIQKESLKKFAEHKSPVLLQSIPEHIKALSSYEEENILSTQKISLIIIPLKTHPIFSGLLYVELPTQNLADLETQKNLLEILSFYILSLCQQITNPYESVLQNIHSENHGSLTEKEDKLQFIAHSKIMRKLVRQIQQHILGTAPLFFHGQDGVGKELAAQLLHTRSARAKFPLINYECSSPLEGKDSSFLTNNEILKLEKLIESAQNGTLILQNFEFLSPNSQQVLYAFLTTKKLQKIENIHPITLDVRVICTSTCSPETLFKNRKITADFYKYIAVFPHFFPELSKRKQDIIPLIEYFLQIYAKKIQKNITRISSSARELLLAYPWKGNIPELQHVIKYASANCTEGVIRAYHLPPTLQINNADSGYESRSFNEHVALFEQELLTDSLQKTNGNMLETARALRVSYRIVQYKAKKYNLHKGLFSSKNSLS